METPLLKIESIRRCINRVLATSSKDPGLASQDAQDVVVLNLQRACEQSLDLANWVCAHYNLSVPRTSQEVFSLLENAGVLSPILANNMRKMVGFRNIAVHEYQELNPLIIKSILSNRLGDFEDFINQVCLNLKIQFSRAALFTRVEPPRVLCLTISDIELHGDDLGDDYQLDFIYADEVVSVPLRTVENKLIAQNSNFATVWLAPETSILNLMIIAKEIDPIADDIGEYELNIDTSTHIQDLQAYEILIEVLGRGRSEQKKKAHLKIKLETLVSSPVVQLKDVDPNGWIIARLSSGISITLPAGTAVEMIEKKQGREYFKVLEGSYKGVEASIALSQGGVTHLTKFVDRKSACEMKLLRESWVLQIAGLGNFEVLKMKPAEMIYPGIYRICLPDIPHGAGKSYRSTARHAETWFRLGDENDRYIHPGTRTRGCITITDLNSWETIYNYIMTCRQDDAHIGTLEVI